MYSQSTTPSSVSINTTTTTTSQSPMLPKQPKQYDASFVRLSSQYGFSAGVPVPSTSPSPTSSRTVSPPPNTAHPNDLNRWDNAYAQLSGQYGCGATVPAPSLPAQLKPSTPKYSSQKPNATPSPPGSDLNRWETAYADLSGQYGFGAAVPVPSLPPKKEKRGEQDAVKGNKRRFGLGLPSLSRK